ncbi:MAG: response regulator [Candidatus Eisenbacteria bacterium]|nr:response regulator [Candidatus Eisenbacteria bacterium]
MTPVGMWRSFAGLRVRMFVLLMAGATFAGVGFELLLVTVTRHWQYQELDVRARSLAQLMAERAATPLMVDDRAELQREARRAASEIDLVGAAFYPLQGPPLESWSAEPGLWTRLGPFAPGPAQKSPVARLRRAAGGEMLDVSVPVRRGAHHASAFTSEASQLFGFPDTVALPPGGDHLGWVRIAVSTDRAAASVRTAANLGMLLLIATLLLGMVAVSKLVSVIVRPLHEASHLAREIASGQLDRRLPVRSTDELGALAASMNTMAGALHQARRTAEEEADALRDATAAVVAIARGARAAHDPRSVFEVVAAEVRRVTRCEGVALAISDPEQLTPRFTFFQPPPPWGGLGAGAAVEPELLRSDGGAGARRLDLAAPAGALARGLAGDGFRSALLLALQFPGAPPALLVLASRDPRGFPPAEADLVAALASHLSSALHAALLQDRLERTFEELQRTHEYLVHSEMLRVAGEMASGVAHEFNNVLGAILGRAQLLARRLEAGTLSPEELSASLAVIVRAALDGGETGRRLRQFGRGSQDAADTVDLDAVIRDAVEFTRTRWENEALAAGRRIEARVDSSAGALVSGRANELREVFTNLILNSVDAMPAGGAIRVTSHTADGQVHVTFEDDGTGMEEETRRRLFEPFFTTKGERGTGLGMSVVYGIVQGHGGSIAVESAPGRGTRYRLAFPLTGAVAPRPAARPAPAGETPPLDVLVVDDDPSVRDVLRDIACALGHRVTACASGEEALAAHRPGRFQLALTDLGMPGMTGWDLARRMRALDPALTIVFVTGWGEEVDPAAVREAGADLVVAKPFTIEDVMHAARFAAERNGLAEAA